MSRTESTPNPDLESINYAATNRAALAEFVRVASDQGVEYQRFWVYNSATRAYDKNVGIVVRPQLTAEYDYQVQSPAYIADKRGQLFAVTVDATHGLMAGEPAIDTKNEADMWTALIIEEAVYNLRQGAEAYNGWALAEQKTGHIVERGFTRKGKDRKHRLHFRPNPSKADTTTWLSGPL